MLEKKAKENDSKLVRDILIVPESGGNNLCQCILLENGKAVEWLRDNQEMWKQQDIIFTKVIRIVPALDCAFVALNQQEEGMLPLKLAPAGLKAGQTLPVQITRLTQPGKGCQVTGRPQLPGMLCVFRPYETRHLKRSKLYMLNETSRLRPYEEELAELSDLWQTILTDADRGGIVPRLLHRFEYPLIQAIRDWSGDHLRSIQIEGPELFAEADRIIEPLAPVLRPKLKLHISNQGYSLLDIHRVGQLADLTARRKIWLPNGGQVVFDQTEALLAVDINSGKAIDKKNPRQTHLQTNQQAAEEIIRQLRLRKIQGLVVIDLIRMKNENDMKNIEEQFQQLCARDFAKYQIGGFTRLGLFELSRSLKKI